MNTDERAALDALVAGQETDDAFLGDRLAILQPRAGYRAGLDAVLLAAACPAPPVGQGFEVLDVGAGVGVAGLAVATRLATARVTLVERDPTTVLLAQRNVERNDLAARCRVVAADVMVRLTGATRDALGSECYDVVIANPPYHEEHRGRPAVDPGKRSAHAMPAGALAQWARFIARMARPGGRVLMIHRAEAVADILAALRGRFGGLRLLALHPRAGEPAIRLLVSGIKGSRAPLKMLPGLVLHGDDGRFRPEIDAILRAPGPLPVDFLV